MAVALTSSRRSRIITASWPSACTADQGRPSFDGPDSSPRPVRVKPVIRLAAASHTVSLTWATASPPRVTTGRVVRLRAVISSFIAHPSRTLGFPASV
jgi:hypothetical protein